MPVKRSETRSKVSLAGNSIVIVMFEFLSKIFRSEEPVKVVEAYRKGKIIFFYIVAPIQGGCFNFAANKKDLFSAIGDIYIKAGCDRMYREKPVKNVKETTKVSAAADIATTLLQDNDEGLFPRRGILYSKGKIIGRMTHDMDDGLFCSVKGIKRVDLENLFKKHGIVIKWIKAPLPLTGRKDLYSYLKED